MTVYNKRSEISSLNKGLTKEYKQVLALESLESLS